MPVGAAAGNSTIRAVNDQANIAEIGGRCAIRALLRTPTGCALIDGEKFIDMLEQLELGLRAVKTYEVDPEFFREFEG